ncbi:ImmA/IrrE family metallo-endopeptidase [Desulfofundulus sp.]|uniref:ImmA/IrrE family metallo-endopeptidase n=1 Tax=Desulfofundulus sp. TaxID=2282750 RepID=UPI003C75C313
MFDWVFKNVMQIIEQYGLVSPKDLADCVGINDILVVPTRILHGGIFDTFAAPLILLSTDLMDYKQIGCLLHEVFHQVLHPHTNRLMNNPYIINCSGRFEVEANVGALIYAIFWDKDLFEQLEYNVFRFAEIYGFPYDAAYHVDLGIQKNGLEIFGITPPDPEFYTP